MKRTFLLLIIILAAISLAGCGTVQNNQTDFLQLIEVELTPPAQIKAGETVALSTRVTQNGQPVEDAQEVRFEIGQVDSDEPKMIEGSGQKDGVYSIETKFEETGTYYIVAHVTARGVHSMPRKQFEVIP
ncbi:FixH family protein [Paenibacillus sp. J2TS4]|uniref:FixH family protein n=1 Tax=Paenibacillus sp. J2TS4 TaxID=2807194 RepID=UPI001B088290|nr:FixH family protein [Paenibacillus sp. J2TS4]GIP35166.1 hypothetical protein J2TS4_43760 [Paenibacillus sp. J2TS4]